MPLKKLVKTALSLIGAALLMTGVAGAGAWAASGLKFGGRALVDIVPTAEIKSAVATTFRYQTADLLSKYAVEVADQAVHLEFSTYDHLEVAYNLAVSLPEDCELLTLEENAGHIMLTGIAEGKAAAEHFEAKLRARGFAVSGLSYAENGEGQCVFYFELPLAEADLAVP